MQVPGSRWPSPSAGQWRVRRRLGWGRGLALRAQWEEMTWTQRRSTCPSEIWEENRDTTGNTSLRPSLTRWMYHKAYLVATIVCLSEARGPPPAPYMCENGSSDLISPASYTVSPQACAVFIPEILCSKRKVARFLSRFSGPPSEQGQPVSKSSLFSRPSSKISSRLSASLRSINEYLVFMILWSC